ncbi:MAG: hypothetical protein WB509_12245 [Acetobacteraceae bacterium]|jgi:hypothetical protein
MRAAVLLLALLLPSLAAAQPRKVDVARSEQTIGSWMLSCAMDPMTDTQVCRMRHKLWLVVPSDGHPGMALEVQLRFDQLVPVVTVRDLSLSTALSGLLALTATAQIRFDAAAMAELPCALDGASVVCAPTKADSAALADQLARAKTVLVRFRAFGNLPLPVPDGPLALDLDRTQEALTRYRVAGPEVAPAPSTLTDDLRDSAERLLHRLGVPGMEGQPTQQK